MPYEVLSSHMARHILTAEEQKEATKLTPLQRAMLENELYELTKVVAEAQFVIGKDGQIENMPDLCMFKGSMAFISKMLEADDAAFGKNRSTHPQVLLSQQEAAS